MTEKEIIIDEVDVSGCIHYEEYFEEDEDTLRKIIKNKEERNIELYKENNQLKVNNEKMSKGYAELTEIVSPYIDDFTGYNEKLGSFDIVLCVKELLQQLDQLKAEKEQAKQKLILIRNFITDVQVCSSASIVCDKILQIIDEVE